MDALPHSRVSNILASVVPSLPQGEQFTTLLESPGLRFERILSPPGHAMGPDEWFDQPWDEFVLVLKGRGALVIEGRDGEIVLNPGDYLQLPAGVRHRVAWTDAHTATVWLALHHEVAGT